MLIEGHDPCGHQCLKLVHKDLLLSQYFLVCVRLIWAQSRIQRFLDISIVNVVLVAKLASTPNNYAVVPFRGRTLVVTHWTSNPFVFSIHRVLAGDTRETWKLQGVIIVLNS